MKDTKIRVRAAKAIEGMRRRMAPKPLSIKAVGLPVAAGAESSLQRFLEMAVEGNETGYYQASGIYSEMINAIKIADELDVDSLIANKKSELDTFLARDGEDVESVRMIAEEEGAPQVRDIQMDLENLEIIKLYITECGKLKTVLEPDIESLKEIEESQRQRDTARGNENGRIFKVYPSDDVDSHSR